MRDALGALTIDPKNPELIEAAIAALTAGRALIQKVWLQNLDLPNPSGNVRFGEPTRVRDTWGTGEDVTVIIENSIGTVVGDYNRVESTFEYRVAPSITAIDMMHACPSLATLVVAAVTGSATTNTVGQHICELLENAVFDRAALAVDTPRAIRMPRPGETIVGTGVDGSVFGQSSIHNTQAAIVSNPQRIEDALNDVASVPNHSHRSSSGRLRHYSADQISRRQVSAETPRHRSPGQGPHSSPGRL